LGIIFPTDELIFFKMVGLTTNQLHRIHHFQQPFLSLKMATLVRVTEVKACRRYERRKTKTYQNLGFFNVIFLTFPREHPPWGICWKDV
jgi:hypothetical protein